MVVRSFLLCIEYKCGVEIKKCIFAELELWTMERFVNLINVNCVVFWQLRWLPTKRKLKKGDYLRHAEAEFNGFRYRDYIFLGMLWFVPMAALVTKLIGNNFWVLFTTLILSIALSYLFHWYFLTYKNKWHKYWNEYEHQTKRQRVVWAIITIVTYILFFGFCTIGAYLIFKA
jgi:hypothetical protein